MVDIITESDLRDLLFAAGTKQFTVAKDTYAVSYTHLYEGILMAILLFSGSR